MYKSNIVNAMRVLLDAGVSDNEIARRLKIPVETVKDFVDDYVDILDDSFVDYSKSYW